MYPNAKEHNPDPAYIRQLLSDAGLSQVAAAKILGVSDRHMRRYVAGNVPCPYPVQFCLETMRRGAAARRLVRSQLLSRAPAD